jgi:hypothetical protein
MSEPFPGADTPYGEPPVAYGTLDVAVMDRG